MPRRKAQAYPGEKDTTTQDETSSTKPLYFVTRGNKCVYRIGTPLLLAATRGLVFFRTGTPRAGCRCALLSDLRNPCGCVLLLILPGTAEREMRFQRMKQEVAATEGGTGSFFAFHGSGPGNWHGILHLGLKNMSGERFAPGVSGSRVVRTSLSRLEKFSR